MHFCVVPGCNNSSTNRRDLSFHRLPLKNKALLKLWVHKIGRRNLPTVPLTSNLTRSCESLASRSRVQLSALARRIGYTRENTGLHSREHWATLARTLGYTRENTWLHSRGHLATLARPLGYTRENN